MRCLSALERKARATGFMRLGFLFSLRGQDAEPPGNGEGIRSVDVGLTWTHLLLVEHFLVVGVRDDERVPVITRQMGLRVAELIGLETTYADNPDLSAINWITLTIKDP